MGISRRELEEIIEWTRSGSRRIRIRFKGYRYSVVIDRFVKAVDRQGRGVSWPTAFGTRSPYDTISSFRIEEVVLESGGQTERFSSLRELLEYVRGSRTP